MIIFGWAGLRSSVKDCADYGVILMRLSSAHISRKIGR